MINSRDLDDLHPRVKYMAKKFITLCREQGIEVLVTSTYRDNASQAALYAEGRTVKGTKKTNAKAGQSLHNYRLAFDFVPIIHGKAAWNDHALFTRCGGIAEGVGLEWAGRWKAFPELAHCQYTQGLTLADLRAGLQIKG